ncbi:hypothetical protein QR685DRAFT_211822 [Neurospora intermedia]|uniref:Secreted protein n=1 Tax=Neurospora intermedia TaxID=5142 RepID=A0ABR3DG87_NEUIN
MWTSRPVFVFQVVTLSNTVQAVLTRCRRSSLQERKQARILTTTEDCRKQYIQDPASLVLRSRFSRLKSLNRIHDLLDGYSAGGFLAKMRSSHRRETKVGSLVMMVDQLVQLIAHHMGPFCMDWVLPRELVLWSLFVAS